MDRTWGALVAVVAVAAQAQAPTPATGGRGELLYATHCQACHTTQVHWREKRLATDWAGLAAQVERWQANARLGWSGEDVNAVARYLNGRFYRFPEAEPVGAGPGAPRT